MQGLHGLRAVTGDYKGLQKTCSLTRMSPDTFSGSIFHKKVTRGDNGLLGVTRAYRELQWVTGGYRGLQKITQNVVSK